jgi:hypothetical protein
MPHSKNTQFSIRRLTRFNTQTRHVDAWDIVPGASPTTQRCTFYETDTGTRASPWPRPPQTPPDKWCTRPSRRSPSRSPCTGTYPSAWAAPARAIPLLRPTPTLILTTPTDRPLHTCYASQCMCLCVTRAALQSWQAYVVGVRDGKRGTRLPRRSVEAAAQPVVGGSRLKMVRQKSLPIRRARPASTGNVRPCSDTCAQSGRRLTGVADSRLAEYPRGSGSGRSGGSAGQMAGKRMAHRVAGAWVSFISVVREAGKDGNKCTIVTLRLLPCPSFADAAPK